MKTHEAKIFCEETERNKEENVDDDDDCHWFVRPNWQFPRLATIDSEWKENIKNVRSDKIHCAALGLSEPSFWKSDLNISVWRKRSTVNIINIRGNKTG